MAVTMKDLGIDKLSIDDRVILGYEIWESINAESESAELTPELKAELEQRIAEDDAHSEKAVPRSVVYERALKRAEA